MDLAVDITDRRDRATAIYRALLAAIRNGRLAAGDRLPPTRELAKDLGVSRTTVAVAYERLAAEGFLASRVGAGTFVTDREAPRARPRAHGALRARDGWTFAPAPTSGSQPKPTHDFRVGIPDASIFPFDSWRRLVSAEIRVGAHDPGTYAGPAGLPRLREAITRYVGFSRGVTAQPDDVIVTRGAQQALDLVARVLVAPGDVVAVEDPGYPQARDVFASHGARVVPVRVDEQGLVVDEVPAEARVVYTTPSHQFPTGPPLSAARRVALLDLAHRHGIAVVEDDYDSEFRFVDGPLDTLHALDTHGRVLYLGTYSKTLVPALRLGYLVVPPSLRDALLAARQLADGYGDPAVEAALAAFLSDGHFAAHVRRARALYGERRALLREELGRVLGDQVRLVPSAAGLHLTVTCHPSVDDAGVVRAAWAHGVALDALSAYAVAQDGPGLVLGYGALDPASIRPGLEVLARSLAAAPSR
ncbi:aminotransferase class I/II-fold pyridoxal phosphate-dependent enzyme [Nocardioides sp. MAH-18]|uniref:Aminotransferase class I/II-fold pyridoxal phosphate-dependent enzyme n=1 Tax=Nocardioides agri TaxID=2682843 RepID=A0A6L6XM35_9ACTN|nr:PLP-dependent aminotransferase family protein [Nocardioides sp. CGMCC 1.13656]MBA2956670.1 PLP-dependent aminotransferase family protein [Nocardioides sp. CGMCC 1.13656]MVQ47813.1 aminotransferase class I/II-fold pyridoxal phosphate-dependent enzyme [Nocardioides sp. MAH-18]